MNSTTKKHFKRILVIILIVFVVTLFANRKAIYIIYRNLNEKILDLDESTEWAGGTSYVAVPYATDSDAQYLDLYVPKTTSDDRKPPLFVLVHGGGFIYSDSQQRQAQFMYRYFRDRGYACASINFRLAQQAPFPAAVCDVKAAVRFLKAHADEYGYDASKVAIWGESAGGYLAVATAVTNDNEFMDVSYIGQEEIEGRLQQPISASVDICIDFYGVIELSINKEDYKKLGIPEFILWAANGWTKTDIIEGYDDALSFWLRKDIDSMTEEERAPSDLYRYIRENLNKDTTTKFWIAHGDCDMTVPMYQSERLYSTLTGLIGEENAEYTMVHGAIHAADMMYTDESLSIVKAYLDTHL